ncbi:MAG: PilZ domain-containing protein [Archangium sp.]
MATTKKPAPPPPSKLPAGKSTFAKPQLDSNHDGPEHRQFPRAQMTVPFRLWVGDGEDLSFEATLRSGNVSVSGAFLSSTFFLPVGTEVRCSFALDPAEDPVLARAQIIRVDQANPRDPNARSGMALRFVEFFEQSEVTLARLFLGVRLEAFAKEYLASKRARALNSELDRCVDALAAWELQKVTSTSSPWAAD